MLICNIAKIMPKKIIMNKINKMMPMKGKKKTSFKTLNNIYPIFQITLNKKV